MTDANVLINLIHVDAIGIVATLPDYEFVVADAVVEEVTEECQAITLRAAFEKNLLRKESVTERRALALFAKLVEIMGRGEAASLALAATTDWCLACDEKRVFRRKALDLVGEDRMLTTPGIMVLCIRAGLITVEEADNMKAFLETKRFRMTFRSFREVV